jgi:hypothetical protein
MTSRIPSDKVADSFKQIAQDVVDPSTVFKIEKIDGKTRLVAEKKSTPPEKVAGDHS